MHLKHFSQRVVTFKLAAALENYEGDLRLLAAGWRAPDALRRVQREFGELRILGASLPRLSVAWVAVLVSRTRWLQALGDRESPALRLLEEHLMAVGGLRRRCLRAIGAHGGALA